MNDECEIEWPEWKCDGENCTVMGSLWKVEKHILAEAVDVHGTLKPAETIRHWGAVGVGSPADVLLFGTGR